MIGFPDWRDANAYPNALTYKPDPVQSTDAESSPDGSAELPLNAESLLWAWQFLRRNPEYQAAWDEHGYKARRDVAQRFGMTMLMDYRREILDQVPFEASMRTLAFGRTNYELLELQLKEHEIAFILDDRIPLSEHKKFITEQFKRIVGARIARDNKLRIPSLRAQESKRIKPVPLSRYLRILDARMQGIGSKVIARHFISEGTYQDQGTDTYYPGQSRIEQDIYRAQKLMREDYLSIAYS